MSRKKFVPWSKAEEKTGSAAERLNRFVCWYQENERRYSEREIDYATALKECAVIRPDLFQQYKKGAK